MTFCNDYMPLTKSGDLKGDIGKLLRDAERELADRSAFYKLAPETRASFKDLESMALSVASDVKLYALNRSKLREVHHKLYKSLSRHIRNKELSNSSRLDEKGYSAFSQSTAPSAPENSVQSETSLVEQNDSGPSQLLSSQAALLLKKIDTVLTIVVLSPDDTLPRAAGSYKADFDNVYEPSQDERILNKLQGGSRTARIMLQWDTFKCWFGIESTTKVTLTQRYFVDLLKYLGYPTVLCGLTSDFGLFGDSNRHPNVAIKHLSDVVYALSAMSGKAQKVHVYNLLGQCVPGSEPIEPPSFPPAPPPPSPNPEVSSAFPPAPPPSPVSLTSVQSAELKELHRRIFGDSDDEDDEENDGCQLADECIDVQAVAREVAQEMTQEVAQEMAQEVAQEVAQEIAQEMSQEEVYKGGEKSSHVSPTGDAPDILMEDTMAADMKAIGQEIHREFVSARSRFGTNVYDETGKIVYSGKGYTIITKRRKSGKSGVRGVQDAIVWLGLELHKYIGKKQLRSAKEIRMAFGDY